MFAIVASRVKTRKLRDREGSIQTAIDVMLRTPTRYRNVSPEEKSQDHSPVPETNLKHDLPVKPPLLRSPPAMVLRDTGLRRLGKEVRPGLPPTVRSFTAKYSLRWTLNGPKFVRVANLGADGHPLRFLPVPEKVGRTRRSLRVEGRRRRRGMVAV